jgi:hypothetical protein
MQVIHLIEFLLYFISAAQWQVMNIVNKHVTIQICVYISTIFNHLNVI